MKRLILLFTIFLITSCFPSTDKTKRFLQSEKSNDIVILHTNDVHCGVQDSIGYDGLMLYKKQLLQKHNNVILVDAGDHIQGGTIGQITSGEAIIDIMNELEYDVVTLGNHEFDYGIEQLETIKNSLTCGYISSNYCYKKNKESIYPPYKIIEKGGKKIGFIGVATPETLTKSYLITLLDDKGELIYDFLTENHNQELYERVQHHIDELQEQKVDYIIILAHMGKGGDSLEEDTSIELLKNLKNVNALIDGHTHLIYSEKTPDKNNNNVILVQTGTKLTNIGVLTIHENGTLSHENIDEVPYDPTLAEQTLNVTRSSKIRYVDKDMSEFINDIYDSFSDKLNEVIGKSDFLINVYKNATESTDSHTQLSRIGENALCNLVADSMRELGEGDITILNAGTVRADINKGNITYQNVLNVLPYSDDIIVKEITGQTILEALEFGVRNFPEQNARFPQVSHITYKLDTSINSSVVVDENKVFKKLGGENRVYDIKINGEKLDLKKKYTISSRYFILNGGDGYSMFANCETIKTSLGVDNEVLLHYIRNNSNGTIPIKYKAAEGRLLKTNGKIYDDISISLFGINDINITSQMIRFNALFTSLEKLKFEFPQQLFLEASLSENSRLRRLQTTNKSISCFIQNEVNETKAIYLCEIPGDNSNIKTIKINEPEFTNFAVKLSSLASNCMTNLDNTQCGKGLDNINEIYILQNATCEKNGSSLLIFGTIFDDELPSFSKKELNLSAMQLPSKNETELKCTIIKVIDSNYTLNCKLKPNIKYEFDNSILYDNDKLLLINFEKGAESQITSDETETKIRRFFPKSSGKLSSGLIALIIVVPIVLVAITIGLILFLTRNKEIPKAPISNFTTTENVICN